VPLNDPFGGWVYWGRVPQAAGDRLDPDSGFISPVYGLIDAASPKFPEISTDSGDFQTSRAAAVVDDVLARRGTRGR
jgi:hypothetical protein